MTETQIAASLPEATKKIAPFGSWISPITADLIVKESIFIGTHGFPAEVRIDGTDVYWLEGRPSENGRGVVVHAEVDEAKPSDTTPRGFDVRTRVYEYGGGAWLIDAGVAYFSNFADGRLYRQNRGGAPKPLTPEPSMDGQQPKLVRHYADGCIDRTRKRWIGVVEDWSEAEPKSEDEHKRQPQHRIVAIDLSRDKLDPGVSLAAGHDFYASPRLSPDGERLAWLAWDHPLMPWQGSTLYLSNLDSNGRPGPEIAVAGGDQESIVQPEWSPDGTQLWFISDRNGWWNLYCYDLSKMAVRGVARMAAEFSRPQWNLGQSTYTVMSDGSVVAVCSQNGFDKLVLIDSAVDKISDIQLFRDYTAIRSVRSNAEGRVVFVAASSRVSMSVVVYDPASVGRRVLKKATDLADDPTISRHLTEAVSAEFPTDGETAFALYYAPANADFAGPVDEMPPLVVMSHGGPTAQASSALNFEIQYWTSRGIAVLDVNYRGSSGFGRAYRDRLKENWGIIDVEDCINGARYLADTGTVDRERTVITGGSAGGYTTLCALTFHDYFRAGGSHYGIGDLEALTRDTHKFESHYLDWLIGPYPEQIDRYRERSPIHHVERLSRPVIFFQGENDQVVPPSQSEAMFNAIKGRGLAAGYLLFAGEQHGFRRADNIRRSIEAEYYFFAFEVFRSRLSFGDLAGTPH